MISSKTVAAGLGLVCLLSAANVRAQHLWWDAAGQHDAKCVYGEITVLATHPGTYYCGINWHPGEPAGGYCGIQQNSPKEKRTIFSIWDTTPELHPKVTAADADTIPSRFGGEGTGAHTHMLWPWKLDETFQFFVEKSPGTQADTTDARYYVYDIAHKKWLHSATINCPNGGKKSVATIGGGMNSFLENFTGQDRDAPRLAIYRLWLGSSVSNLKYLRRAVGDGTWGELHDAYFLAAGSKANLDTTFAKLEKQYGKPIYGEKDKKLDPISDRPVPTKVIAALKDLPKAEPVAH